MKKEKNSSAIKGVSLRTIGIIISVFATLISGFLVASLFLLSSHYRKVNTSTKEYMRWENVASDIQSASDYLTSEVRSFVVTGKKEHMENYFYESNVAKRRENAIKVLEENLEGTDVDSYVHIAINESMDLMNQEFYAMRLICDVKSVDYFTHVEIVNVVLTDADAALDNDEKINKATDLVFGTTYLNKKGIITTNTTKAVNTLDEMMQEDINIASTQLKKILIMQQSLIGINVIFLMGLVFVLIFYFMKPLNRAVRAVENGETVNERGVKEFAYVASTYNRVHTQNINIKERLKYEAEHDKLTHLYNRTGYDSIYKHIDLSKAVYILIDGDNFKEINDQYGHTMGDKVLVRLARALDKYFGDDVDANVFRIGGDEFTILIENYDPKNEEKLRTKLHTMSEELLKKIGEIPGISLSIGVAYGKGADTTDSLFRKADKALYYVKKHGRNGIAISR